MSVNQSITLKGKKIDYLIKRVEGFGRILFEIRKSGELLITLPAYVPDRKIPALLKDSSQLILDQYQIHEQENAPKQPQNQPSKKDKELQYAVIRKNTTRISIKINPIGEISLIIPEKYPLEKAVEFLESKKDWINSVLDKINNSASHPHQRKMIFEERALVFEGKKSPLKITENPSLSKSLLKIKQSGNEPRLFEEKPSCIKTVFELYTPSFSNRPEVLKTLIHGLKAHAKKELKKLLDEESQKAGIQYNALRVKEVKTRWGSCSAQKNINLCWRLILLPRECQRYVAIHELCHIREMNHSARFWNLVREFMPDFAHWRKHLKKNGGIAHTL